MLGHRNVEVQDFNVINYDINIATIYNNKNNSLHHDRNDNNSNSNRNKNVNDYVAMKT